MRCRSGFTLVEMSIVLVIVGLVAAGIMVGRDLIRAAEIRKIHTQYQGFVTAIATFKVKYNCLPGDCPNATDVFDAYDPGGACPPNDTPPGSGTCDGDGNGLIAVAEGRLLWQHLANAGLIGGLFSGAFSTIPTSNSGYLPGSNCPAILTPNFCWVSRSNAGYSIGSDGVKNKLLTWPMTYQFGGAPRGTLIFTGAEANAYDTKYDDGTPDKGSIRAMATFLIGWDCTFDDSGTFIYASGSAGVGAQRNCGLVYDIKL